MRQAKHDLEIADDDVQAEAERTGLRVSQCGTPPHPGACAGDGRGSRSPARRMGAAGRHGRADRSSGPSAGGGFYRRPAACAGILQGALCGCEVDLPEKAAAVFAGKLVFVSPEVDPVNNQVRVLAEIDNPESLLRPGLRATLTIDESATRSIPDRSHVAP